MYRKYVGQVGTCKFYTRHIKQGKIRVALRGCWDRTYVRGDTGEWTSGAWVPSPELQYELELAYRNAKGLTPPNAPPKIVRPLPK